MGVDKKADEGPKPCIFCKKSADIYLHYSSNGTPCDARYAARHYYLCHACYEEKLGVMGPSVSTVKPREERRENERDHMRERLGYFQRKYGNADSRNRSRNDA